MRVEEILDYVVWEICWFGYECKLIGGIVFIGGGVLLNYIDKFIEFYMGMSIWIGIFVEYLVYGYSEYLSSLKYVMGVGLFLKGLEDLEVGKVVVEEEKEEFVFVMIEEDNFNKWYE